MKYFIIGDEDTVLGFGLVGVEGQAVKGPEQALEAFNSALNEREIGIVIMTERVADLIRPQVDRYVFTEDFPGIWIHRIDLSGKAKLDHTLHKI